MEVALNDSSTLKLPARAVAYILDVLATQPFKDVNPLINDILSQLKSQEKRNESENVTASAGPAPADGVSGFGSADR
jgi:hypothetical protein